MGRRLFARFGISCSVALLSVACSTPVLAGPRSEAPAASSPANDLEAASTLDLTGLQGQFSKVADAVSPSVVAISASCTPIDGDEVLQADNLNPQKLDHVLSKTTRTVGTGFFVDADGYILTNEHVICEAEQLWVTTDNKKVYPAIVIGTDPRADLAILKIPATHCKTVNFAKATNVRRGQWTIAVGNPYGLAAEGELAMSVGVVSATNRSLAKLSSKEGRLYTNLIQTTAEINPGNSGGPLFNLAGEVIGINTAVILPQKQTNGIGFAIPVSERLTMEIDQLKQGREVVYGYLGVTVTDPTERDRRVAGSKLAGGARVDGIEEKSPADGTKLKVDDIVIALNGAAVADSDALIRMIGQTPVDAPAKLTVYRSGKSIEIEVTPRKRPMPQVAINRDTQRMRWRGITVSSLPHGWQGKPGEATGLFVVGIDDADAGKKLGLRQGSIITAVAGKVVRSITDLQAVINSNPPETLKIETADSASIATAQQ
jgi:S1-C subfamily serine protease